MERSENRKRKETEAMSSINISRSRNSERSEPTTVESATCYIAGSSRHPDSTVNINAAKVPRLDETKADVQRAEETGCEGEEFKTFRTKQEWLENNMDEEDKSILTNGTYQLPAVGEATSFNVLPPSFVTKNKPFIGTYSNTITYANTNVKCEHKYHRTGEGLPPWYPMSVDDYERLGRADGSHLLDALRYKDIPDTVPLMKRGSDQADTLKRSMFKRNWKHLGDDAGRYLTGDRCDLYCVRTKYEVSYVQCLEKILDELEKGGLKWSKYRDAPSALPTPLIDFYYYRYPDSWDEDELYDVRMRTERQSPRLSNSGYSIVHKNRITALISWNWISGNDTFDFIRRELFMHVTDFMKSIELSPVIASPSTLVPTYYFGRYKNGNAHLRHGMINMMDMEQARFNMLSWIFAVRYGVGVSRLGDPRITQSRGYGIMTPVPEKLVEFTDATFVATLIGDEPDIFLGDVMYAFAVETDVKWEELDRHMEHPFVLYDWGKKDVVDMPLEREREFHFSMKKIEFWRTRVFREVTNARRNEFPTDPYDGYCKFAEKLLVQDGYRTASVVAPADDKEVTTNDETDMEVDNIPEEDRYMFEHEQERWFNPLMASLQETFAAVSKKMPTCAEQFLTTVKTLMSERDQSGNQADVINNLKAEVKRTELLCAAEKSKLSDMEQKMVQLQGDNDRLVQDLRNAKAEQHALTKKMEQLREREERLVRNVNRRHAELLRKQESVRTCTNEAVQFFDAAVADSKRDLEEISTRRSIAQPATTTARSTSTIRVPSPPCSAVAPETTDGAEQRR